MTEQSTEAARVKVADAPIYPWKSYHWDESHEDDVSCWWEDGFSYHKWPLQKGCQGAIKRDPSGRHLLMRYPTDPEALYFSADHPEGVPVEWEDAR